MKSQRLNIGIIGCGWIAEYAHIPAFKQISDVKISSVFDIDIGRAARLAKAHDIQGIYSSLNDFLDSGIDAVIVATPNHSHAQYTMESLRRGLHVICEKPVAIRAGDVKQIIEIAEQNQLVYFPAFVNRFRYDVLKMREFIQSNRIGEIIHVEAGWLRRSGIPRPGTWFTNKALSGGGVLIDLGSHMVDICLMLFGDKQPLSQNLDTVMQESKADPLDAGWFKGEYSVGLPMDVEVTAISEIGFSGSSKLNLKLSWAADINGDCTYFIVKGTKGNIKLKTLFGFSNDKLWNEDSLIVEDSAGVEVITLDNSINNAMEAFHAMGQFFADTIRGGATRYLTGSDGLRTVELIEKLYSNENRIDRETAINDLEGLRFE
ncbi:Gfo/Idh/MocA family protein [Paenibacillus macquariensis]|nr:Gfo/Idh/MocA family oxidoreductase [Paenibacillus macquariensis]MEC0090211.1 Gfo/Idh/MocA family oxidoreductase [Paenibacillus macquariensis]OAB39745.1 dehydrogenase [Paenibacillus macquariensis subsp. macquariensis]